jgi:hypothetical protein
MEKMFQTTNQMNKHSKNKHQVNRQRLADL